MFVCPPKAENIHQLIEEQRMWEKKQALVDFIKQERDDADEREATLEA